MSERDRPPLAEIAKPLLKSVGIQMKTNSNGGIKFVFKNQQTLTDLEQLGFSIDVLKIGEINLPDLAIHMDNQASLEAYWGAMAERARYEFNKIQDEFNYWFETKYSKCFAELQDRGIPKPTQKEVDSRISWKYSKKLNLMKERVRIAERNYRILNNACFVSIVTKGKMLQSLRNIVQGGNSRFALCETEDGSPKINQSGGLVLKAQSEH